MRRSLRSAFFALLFVEAAVAQGPERRGAVARRIESPPTIDGLLDEAVWSEATPIGELIQVEPREGVPPSEASDIRILYDSDQLYIGIRCFDREPSRIVSTKRERDAFLDADDRIEIILDTFLDRRSAFFFQINPTGSKGDALITGNGRDFNKPWDGIWEGIANVDGQGWTAELALPFKTLNFRPGLTTWGLNVARFIGRRNEETRWSGARQDLRFFNVYEGGDLRGLEGMQQGVGLDVVPFFVGNWVNEREVDEEHLLGSFGGDIFYKLTPSLTASVTVNTDFAETEVDERQINLTRFPLFFPERRDFFLQDAGVFEFADLGNDLVPFFSRTIGLVDGEEVPIDVGAKLTGRAGPYNIGTLDVQMDKTDVVDRQNLFVTRISRNVGEQSSIGGIVTHGNPESNDDNLLYGVDANYRTSSFLSDKTLTGSAWMLGTESEDRSGDELAYGASLRYPNDLWSWDVDFKEIQENFNPALGFVRRDDIRKYRGGIEYQPRINDVVRQLEFGVEGRVVTDTDDELESAEIEVQPFGIEWDSGDELQVEIERHREDLTDDFEIRDDDEDGGEVVIDEDDYSYTRYRLEFSSAEKRALGINTAFAFGDFFDGDREDYEVGLEWRPNALFNGAIEYERNDVSLDDGDFTTEIARLRLAFAFSPDLSWSNLIQWDSDSDSYGLNSRLRWIPKPGQEVFLVFNETLVEEDDTISPAFQEVAFKVLYTLRF